jgi:hypothetical protein
MAYKYECPTSKGYERFRISNKDQNRIFEYRKTEWSTNYEFYVKDNHIIMYAIPNVLGCIASTLLLPIGILVNGLSNTKETYRSMVTRVWNCKECGAFSGDDIYRLNSDGGTFDDVLRCRKEM